MIRTKFLVIVMLAILACGVHPLSAGPTQEIPPIREIAAGNPNLTNVNIARVKAGQKSSPHFSSPMRNALAEAVVQMGFFICTPGVVFCAL